MKSSLLLPLAISLAALSACTDATVAKKAVAAQDSEVSATPSAAVHGMVIFGTDTLFVSHIPMYMSPHDYQAIMQVKLTHASSDALAVYQKALGASGKQTLFTVRPKPFILPNLLNGKIKSFTADLYKGNFEQGGKIVLSNVTVTVEENLYTTQLSKSTPAAGALNYIPVETSDSSYLVHQISAPNNFDHIVQIEWLNKTATVSPLELKSFPLADKEANRLTAGQYFSVSDDGTIEEIASAAGATFRVVSDFYCTQGPDFYNLCD
jgi:hypothetical protein